MVPDLEVWAICSMHLPGKPNSMSFCALQFVLLVSQSDFSIDSQTGLVNSFDNNDPNK